MSEAPPEEVWTWTTSPWARAVSKIWSSCGRQASSSARPPSRKLVLRTLTPVLAGVRERRGVELGVLRPWRDPQPAADPVVGGGGLQHELVERERDGGVGHPVVREHQRPLGALGVQIGEELGDGAASRAVRVDRRAAVERDRPGAGRCGGERRVRVSWPCRSSYNRIVSDSSCIAATSGAAAAGRNGSRCRASATHRGRRQQPE